MTIGHGFQLEPALRKAREEQNRPTGETSPRVPEGKHRERGLLRRALQFDDREMPAASQVADIDFEVVASTLSLIHI